MRRHFCALVALSALAACGRSTTTDATPRAPAARAARAAVKASSLADLLLTIVPDSADVAPGDSVALRPMLTDPATGVTREATRDEVYVWGVGYFDPAITTWPYFGLEAGNVRGTMRMYVVSYPKRGTPTLYHGDTAVVTTPAAP